MSINPGVMPSLSDKLFPGSPISVEENLLAILSFSQSENLSGEGFARLLKLIELPFLEPNNCCKSFEQLQSHFKTVKTPMKSYFYCSKCLKALNSLTDNCDECKLLKPSVDQVIVLSLKDQLSEFYSRPGFLEDIQYRFNRHKLNPDNIEDLFDGTIYKEVVATGLLADKHNVSIMWNGDGASPYESSSLQIWPFFGVVNELPPNKRFKHENLLLSAVFIGKQKPHPNIFLKNVYSEVIALKEGFTVHPHDCVEPIVVKAVFLCGTCDSPAKSLLFNQKYYNGHFSCPKCLNKGEKSERTEDVFVHPYEGELTLRTELSYEEDASTAAVTNANLPKSRRITPNGIKGTTYLYLMVHSMIKSTAIDSLHCLYLGVTRQLLDLWFSRAHRKELYSLYTVEKLVSSRLMSICPPHFVKRMPRSLKDMSNWKGYEFMLMFYYYLLPSLSGIMQQIYFHNFKLLVAGISLLNQRSISDGDIREAECLLKQFVLDFQELYSLRNMSFNCHLILHLCELVRALGPIFCYSCFRFEDFNAKLLRLIHGSRYAGSQIATGIFAFLCLPKLVATMKAGKAKEFCTSVARKGKRVKLNECVIEDYFSVGIYRKATALPEWMLNALHEHQFCSVFTFNRIKVKNMLVTSDSYRKCNTCSKFVRYFHNGEEKYGLVKEFVKITNCECVKNCKCSGEFFAFLSHFSSEVGFKTFNPPASLKHMKKCQKTEDIHLVLISSIINVCFYIQSDTSDFLCDPINDMEMYN